MEYHDSESKQAVAAEELGLRLWKGPNCPRMTVPLIDVLNICEGRVAFVMQYVPSIPVHPVQEDLRPPMLQTTTSILSAFVAVP